MKPKKPQYIPHDLKADPRLLGMEALAYGEDAITVSEKRGQSQMVHSDVLPNRLGTQTRELLESWGFQIGEVLPGDDMFLAVTFPDGWTKKATDHYMYSDLLDPQGRKRGQIGYKPSSYDRWVSFHLCRRYNIQIFKRKQDDPVEAWLKAVYDQDTLIHRPSDEELAALPPRDLFGPDLIQQLCEAYLNEHFPDWQNPGAYWD